ncbi:RFC checkpoint protein Rad17 [Malassezia obtusa]|uniref:RFC checkpoint protein Rad17 n=1 Tax=Malassezia obtusa TaxID=76774 RepID=A0AAF0E795_9BASI|nr:RFC checkpoint protein Rad17 [Malassezia obtusa]
MPRRAAVGEPPKLTLTQGVGRRKPMAGAPPPAPAPPPAAPTQLEALPVHKRKVADVRAWLAEAFAGPTSRYRVRRRLTQRLLALTGPCGAGKTSTVHALAQRDALDFDIVEWDNKDSFYDAGERQSAIDRFAAFLHNAQRYPALPLAPRHAPRAAPRRRKIVLVEDLPNVAHDATRAHLHQILDDVVDRAGPVPVVLIISDSVPRAEEEASAVVGALPAWRARREARLDVRAVVPERVRMHAAFAEIRFNPVTPRMIQSALSARAAQLDVPRGLLADISNASAGDLRGAENTLALLAAGRARTGTKRKAHTGVDVAALTPRASALVLFHALGRVLYNKRAGDPGQEAEAVRAPRAPPWHASPRPSLVDVDELWRDLPVDPSTFQLYLYHNFPSFTNELEEVAPIADALSCAEHLPATSDEPRASAAAALYAYEISTRGTLLGLPSPVPRRGQVMTKPALYDLAQRTQASVDALADARLALLQSAELHDVHGRAADVPLTTVATELLPLLARIDPAWRSALVPFAEAPVLAEPQGDEPDVEGSPPAADALPRAPPRPAAGPLDALARRSRDAPSDEELDEL